MSRHVTSRHLMSRRVLSSLLVSRLVRLLASCHGLSSLVMLHRRVTFNLFATGIVGSTSIFLLVSKPWASTWRANKAPFSASASPQYTESVLMVAKRHTE